MAEKLSTITELDPQSIVVGPRLRPASAAGVAAVKASIIELDTLQSPIHVRKKRNGDFVLLSGLHRLTAVRELEWSMIPVVAWKCTDDWARLMEVDDNLAGAELTPLDTALFLAERKRVYEKLHPETKAGVAGAEGRWNATDTMSVASFTATTAEKFGMSERHVRRMIAAGAALTDDDVALFRDAERHVTLSDLQTISKVDPDLRYRVCAAVAGGEAKNAASAVKLIKSKGVQPPVKSADEAAFAKLKETWARAPKAAQRRFVETYAAQISDLLPEGGDA